MHRGGALTGSFVQGNISAKKIGQVVRYFLLFLFISELLSAVEYEFLNRRAYDKIFAFVPSEGSYIEVEQIEAGQVGGVSIRLHRVEEQEGVMEALSQLEYGGFYLPSDRHIRYREALIRTEDTKMPRYEVFIVPEDDLNASVWLSLSEEQAYEKALTRYPLKLNNVEPALDYFDRLFDVNEQ